MSQYSIRNKHEPVCPLAHALINKVSVVVGNCDLLLEQLPEDSSLLSRLKMVRDTANSIAADLVEFQQDLAGRCIEEKQTASKA